jgi:hypothetical protein
MMIIRAAQVSEQGVDLDAIDEGHPRRIFIRLGRMPNGIELLQFDSADSDLSLCWKGHALNQIARRLLDGDPVEIPIEVRWRPEWEENDAEAPEAEHEEQPARDIPADPANFEVRRWK